jgi:hypothetical protein
MEKPQFEIVIGKTATDCRVSVQGQDITALLSGVRVECLGGELPTATLFVKKGRMQTTLEAAIAEVTIEHLDDDTSTDAGPSQPMRLRETTAVHARLTAMAATVNAWLRAARPS